MCVIMTDTQMPAQEVSSDCPGTKALVLDTHHMSYCRDADETKEWIEEKNQALNTDNYGHDLASVQALQRKHEGFERDLAALGDKVRDAWGKLRPKLG